MPLSFRDARQDTSHDVHDVQRAIGTSLATIARRAVSGRLHEAEMIQGLGNLCGQSHKLQRDGGWPARCQLGCNLRAAPSDAGERPVFAHLLCPRCSARIVEGFAGCPVHIRLLWLD